MAQSASRTHANPPEQPHARADTAPEAIARAAATAQPSRKRLVILALLFVTVVISLSYGFLVGKVERIDA